MIQLHQAEFTPAQWKTFAKRFQRAVVDWYRVHQRDLPFRHTNDPYAILVSEMMLQQTQVTTVLPYYRKFMERFPTVRDLASATEDELMTYWAGLGYYRRARLLHAAAKHVVMEFGGEFPQDRKTLQTLPGLGRYTAAAVSSSAFGNAEAILEANTLRLYARVFCVEDSMQSGSGVKRLWELAERVTPKREVREFNYGAMELGALVCKPAPLCGQCPVKELCCAFQTNSISRYPVQNSKKEWLAAETVCLVLRCDDLYYVRQVPRDQWHAGLWEFPSARVAPGQTHEQALAELIIMPCNIIDSHFAEFRYTVTRHRVRMVVCLAETKAAQCDSIAGKWLPLNDIANLGLASVQKKLLLLLTEGNDLFQESSL